MLLRQRFGFYPHPLNIQAGPISISPLGELGQTAKDLAASIQVESNWIYAPPQRETHFPSGRERVLPYPARVFPLPETHLIEHANATGDDHLGFHLWALSFFVGMRLTATEPGFLDATPLKKGTLVDFFLPGGNLDHAVALAERFWQENHDPGQSANENIVDRPGPGLFAAAVHALFLAQNPRNLEFEMFVYLYMALDACFRLTALSRNRPEHLSHGHRIQWMCEQFGAEPPLWGAKQDGQCVRSGSEVAGIRNATFHEALFMGSPLGFASRKEGGERNRNLTLEMRALTCRFLVALMVTGSGMVDPSDAVSDTKAWADYVRSPVNARATHRLVLSDAT